MTKLVFPAILICVVYVADSFSIDSTFNRAEETDSTAPSMSTEITEILGCRDKGGNDDCSNKKRSCTNKPEKKSEYDCGSCIDGYREDTEWKLCIEILGCRDEGGNDDCSNRKRSCTNKWEKKSEYVCGSCIDGYREDKDTELCIEILGCRDEGGNEDCLDKKRICFHKPEKKSEYVCGSCIAGYREDTETKQCIEILGCRDEGGNKDCSDERRICTNRPERRSEYVCGSCIAGYREDIETEICIEIIHECKYTDCTGNNTQCVANGINYNCECLDGFRPKDEAKKGRKDADCIEDVYECKPTDCTGENTQCVTNDKYYTCECKVGFKPRDEAKKGQKDAECIEIIHECQYTDCTGKNTKCVANGINYDCECVDGFRPKDEAKKGQRDADCIEDIYECKPYDCTGQNTQCVTNGKYYTCECKVGFKPIDEAKKGQKNAECIAICDEDRNDCENGAKCIPLGNQRFCHCLKGTYGDKCQYMGDCNERYNLKCNYKKGEICAYNTTLEESECLCLESGLHYDTEQRMCRKTCMVGNHDCKNNATCESVSNYGFCECYPGTSGHKCEIVEDCNLLNCNNTGARCEYNGFFMKAKCVCDDGLKYDESISLCRETCDKNRDNCRNGAHCNYIGSYYFCECLPGISGHRCEKVEDEREYSPLLLIILCITSGFLLLSTITLVTVFIKFRSGRNKK